MARFAILVPCLKAKPPGTPMLTKTSVSFPAVVASAFSSQSVRSSNHFSTSAALPSLTPRSISVAPKENKPLGIPIRPEPIPARTDSNVPTLLVLSVAFPYV